MRRWLYSASLVTTVFLAGAASAAAQVCVSVDSAKDTLTQADRDAAVVLITRQFELAGERLVPAGCPREFVVSHVRLLDTIVVSMTGPGGARREAVAQGSSDLLAVYSQMVRSLLTGRPMGDVTDRTNVTETQATARRVHSDSVWYARLGSGALFAGKTHSAPALGLGFRAEMDEIAIDVSFLSALIDTSQNRYDSGSAHSLLKLSGLYFLDPTADRSVYVGAGVSYGYQAFRRLAIDSAMQGPNRYFEGNGLQGELTVGYEIARATSFRVFAQADAVLPFYSAQAETYDVRTGRPLSTVHRQYAPSLVVSIGLGR